MIRLFRKLISLTLVAAFLLGLFPALETPASARLYGESDLEATVQFGDGLEVSSQNPYAEWLVNQDAKTVTCSNINSHTSALRLRNTAGTKKTLSFSYNLTTSNADGGAFSGSITLQKGEKSMFSYELEPNNAILVSLKTQSTIQLSNLLLQDAHRHPLGATGNVTDDPETFMPWSVDNSLPKQAGNYYLTCDVTIRDTWSVPAGTVRLCLNGHKIEADHTTKPYFSVITLDKQSGAQTIPNLTLCDCEGHGLITGGTGTTRDRDQQYRILTQDNAEIDVDSRASDTVGGGVFLRAGSLSVYGGAIAGNTADYGGGIYAECWSNYVQNQNRLLLDGTACVRDNRTNLSGNYGHSGGICLSARMIGEIKGSASVRDNQATKYAGGIGVEDSASLTISGGSITGNEAPTGGGLAIYGFRQPATVTVTGGSITGNTATERGAGIAVFNPTAQYQTAFSTSKLQISGKPYIVGNNLKTGAASNVYLYTSNALNMRLSVIGALENGARVGVDRDTDHIFTNGYKAPHTVIVNNSQTVKDPAQYFISDQGSRAADINEDEGGEVYFVHGVDIAITPYLQNLDGSFTAGAPETRTVKDYCPYSLTEDDCKTYEGFTYDAGNSNNVTSTGAQNPTGATVLKQYYTRNSYSVSYSCVGAVPENAPALPETAGHLYGDAVTVAPAPTLSGYTFSGWTAPAGVSVDGNHQFTMGLADVAFTGSWSLNTYTISCDLTGGTVATANPTSYNVTSSDITLTNPTRTGYTFAGWTGTGLEAATETVTIDSGSTGNRSYTATWTMDSYSIGYHLGGGTVATANPTSYNVTSSGITLNNPTKAGYTFAGWTGTGLTAATETVTIDGGSTGARSYTAHWTANTNTAYKVEHYQQNADNNGYTLAETESLTGTTDTTATATAKTYPHFTYNSAKGVKSGNIAGNGTLTLKLYYDREVHNVSYRYTSDVPAGAPAAPATRSYRYGATVSLEATPTMVDHVLFGGWTPEGSVLVSEGTFIMGEQDVSFTGEWEEGYSLRFRRADGTVVNKDTQAALGTPVTIEAPSLSSGFRFWYSSAFPDDTVAGGAEISGITQSREYAEYKYFVTLINGDSATTVPTGDSVTMPGLDDAGKVWQKSDDNSFAEGGATVGVTGDTTFTVVNKTPISIAAISVTEPLRGASPDESPGVDDSAPFSAGQVVWKKKDGTTLTGTQTFDAGVPYTATVTLTPNPGYQFTSDTRVTLNGGEVLRTANADGALTVSGTFTVPTIKRADWSWESGYASADVTVTYSTDATETPGPVTVTNPSGEDGNTTIYRADATAMKHGPQTVSTELSVTRSGGRVTGVNVKTWVNGELTVNTTVTVSGGAIQETAPGLFSVTGSGTLTTIKGGAQRLYENRGGTLTADGLYQGNTGTAPGSGDDSSDDSDTGSGGSGGSGAGGGAGIGGAGGTAVAGAPYTGPAGGMSSGHAFEDVQPGDWCYDAVAYMLGNGWMTGLTETEFAPSDAATRAMVVTVLYRMAGHPAFAEESTYTDVMPDRFYAGAVAWAQENGITLGVSSSLFRPEEAVTREQFVTFLYRYALYRSVNTEGRDDLSRYADWETISSYAENPMQWAADAGIVVGRSILLAPHEPATRAEIATMLMRFCTVYVAAALPI